VYIEDMFGWAAKWKHHGNWRVIASWWGFKIYNIIFARITMTRNFIYFAGVYSYIYKVQFYTKKIRIFFEKRYWNTSLFFFNTSNLFSFYIHFFVSSQFFNTNNFRLFSLLHFLQFSYQNIDMIKFHYVIYLQLLITFLSIYNYYCQPFKFKMGQFGV
jgi:hypothetical protein